MNAPTPTANTTPEADPAPASDPVKMDPVLKLRDAMTDALYLLNGYAEEQDPERRKSWRNGTILLCREIKTRVCEVLDDYENEWAELLRRVNEEGDRRLAAVV
jgi:hypothetical protein